MCFSLNKKHLLNKIALFLSGFLFVWSVWQHEVLVWDWVHSVWDESFAFFSGVVTTKGVAYDWTLGILAFSFFLGLLSLWTWNE